MRLFYDKLGFKDIVLRNKLKKSLKEFKKRRRPNNRKKIWLFNKELTKKEYDDYNIMIDLDYT